jgi:hypothetical protein
MVWQASTVGDLKMARLDDLVRFYAILDRLERTIGGARTLADCTGRRAWPERGVYFFQEPGEIRTDSGEGARIVRVGTHALKEGSRTTLWTRLSQHKGQAADGGGNHRGSIFRLIVGAALIRRDGLESMTWGDGNSAPREVRMGEVTIEQAVSRFIGQMPFLWLSIDDEPGPQSVRGYIERNAIALLSNYRKAAIDPPTSGWLGRHSDRERVRESGLWNQNHVDEPYAAAFLDHLDELVTKVRRVA